MTNIKDLQNRYREFVDERDWNQFHTPKNLAEAISIEANELLEVFLWQDNLSSDDIQSHSELRSRAEEELADVIIYSLGLAEQLDIELIEAVEAKMDDNEQRFDEEKAEAVTEDLQKWTRD